MNLGSLLLLIGTIAILLSLISSMGSRKKRNWWLQFLQHFCGTLFVISGFVKAIDPLGTAYKMEQYFAEFESTLSGTWFSFLAPLFPALSAHSDLFSIGMIVLEILLGLMLIFGVWKNLTSWAFLLLVAFFTVLTGFTYLTGYVPTGANFFDFSAWGPYTKTNMRVTDCGCFGDFIKLEPGVSFLKDLFLLVPALIFVFARRSMVNLLTERTGQWIVAGSGVVILAFCLWNTYGDLPPVDFRPFREGLDLRAQKIAEEDAQANVQITAWRLKNKETGEDRTLTNDEYMSNLAQYKGTWEVTEQIKSEPAIPITKISDFELSDAEGTDMTYDILDEEGPLLLVISYKLKASSSVVETQVLQDTIWAIDTVATKLDTQYIRRIEQIDQQTIQKEDVEWAPGFRQDFTGKISPMVREAEAAGIKTYLITAFIDPDRLADFRKDCDYQGPVLMADDILLKTIIRSNPGVVLMKNGVILRKWHHRHLPSFEVIRGLAAE